MIQYFRKKAKKKLIEEAVTNILIKIGQIVLTDEVHGNLHGLDWFNRVWVVDGENL